MIVDYNSKNLVDTSSEANLQIELIRWLKSDQTDHWLFTASLGEFLDTDGTRIKANKMGYVSGSPDITIYNSNKHHSGILIELKVATGFGDLSKKQSDFLTKAEQINPKLLVIISNNLKELISTLTKYKYNIPIDQTITE